MLKFAIFSSLIKICPEVGSINRLTIFIVVVFPQPLGPINVTNSPLSTRIEITSKASVPPDHVLCTSLNSITYKQLFSYRIYNSRLISSLPLMACPKTNLLSSSLHEGSILFNKIGQIMTLRFFWMILHRSEERREGKGNR